MLPSHTASPVPISRPTEDRRLSGPGVCNSAKDDESCCNGDENLVRLFADGSCMWSREFQLSVTHCSMHVLFFPFDKQQCHIVFESKTRDNTQLDFTPVERGRMLTLYKSSGEWRLLGKILYGLLGPFYGAIAVPFVTRCRCRCCGHRCAGGVRQ